MGRGGEKKREREGHRYTAIGRKSNEDDNRGRGIERAQVRREERTETEEGRKIGREKSVYSGKCMREG